MGFAVDVRDIEREEAEADEHQTDEKEIDIGKDGRSREIEAPIFEDIAIEKHHETEYARKKRDDDAAIARQLERHVAVCDKACDGKIQKTLECIGRHAIGSIFRIEQAVGTGEAQPVDQSSRDAIALGQSIEFIGDSAIDQSEIGGSRDEFGLGDGIHNAIVEF